MTRNVSTLILRASKVSSGTAIAAAIEVSLNSEMNVLPSAGSELRSMIGKTTSSAICAAAQADRPPGIDDAGGTEASPARNTSVR